MNSIAPFKLYVGESIEDLPDGGVRLIMRSGEVEVFSKEEWEYHLSTFEMDVPDMIDYVLNEIKGRDIVTTAEMIDYLLDIRTRAESVQRALKESVKTMFKFLREDENEG